MLKMVLLMGKESGQEKVHFALGGPCMFASESMP